MEQSKIGSKPDFILGSNYGLNSNQKPNKICDIIFVGSTRDENDYCVNLREDVENSEKEFFSLKKRNNTFTYAFLIEPKAGKIVFKKLTEYLILLINKMNEKEHEIIINEKDLSLENITQAIFKAVRDTNYNCCDLEVFRTTIINTSIEKNLVIATRIGIKNIVNYNEEHLKYILKYMEADSLMIMGNTIFNYFRYLAQKVFIPSAISFSPYFFKRRNLVYNLLVEFDCYVRSIIKERNQKRKLDNMTTSSNNEDDELEVPNPKRVKYNN